MELSICAHSALFRVVLSRHSSSSLAPMSAADSSSSAAAAAAVAGSSSAAVPALSTAHASHPLQLEGQQVRSDILVCGVPTSVIITSFVDRIFVAITQNNKMGGFTLAATAHANPSVPDSTPSYSIATLLGPRSAPVPQLLARQLIESLSRSDKPHMAAKSMLLSLALQKPKRCAAKPPSSSADDGVPSISEEEAQTVRALLAEIDKIRMW